MITFILEHPWLILIIVGVVAAVRALLHFLKEAKEKKWTQLREKLKGIRMEKGTWHFSGIVRTEPGCLLKGLYILNAIDEGGPSVTFIIEDPFKLSDTLIIFFDEDEKPVLYDETREKIYRRIEVRVSLNFSL